MKIQTIAFVSAAALALAGCGQKATTDNTAMTTTSMNTTDMTTNMTEAAPSGGQTFANTAAASDAFEIATSNMALTNGKSAAVKKYATAMIAAHTASTAKLKSTAMATTPALTPDATLNAEQQAQVDLLKTKTGADFDRAFIDAQTAGHQKTLDALKAYAATGDVPALKTLASGMVPTVAAHLNMAKGLKG